jgi:hypothetical protein
MQFSLRSKYSCQHPVLKHSHSVLKGSDDGIGFLDFVHRLAF